MARKTTTKKTVTKTTKKTTAKKTNSRAETKKTPAQRSPYHTENGKFAKGNPGKPHGTKNRVTKATKFDIWEALEKASQGIGLKECFDPLKELMIAIRDPEIEPADKGHLCAKLLEFLYPKKKAIEVNFDPENMPAIVATIVPDADAAPYVDGLLPPGTPPPPPGTPVVINIGGDASAT